MLCGFFHEIFLHGAVLCKNLGSSAGLLQISLISTYFFFFSFPVFPPSVWVATSDRQKAQGLLFFLHL